MPLHCCTSIIKVKMNCCFVLVFLLCGLARRIHLNINYNYNYFGPMYTTSDITPSSQLTLLMCPSFDYKYFPACPNIVAGWKDKEYKQIRSTDKKGPVIVTTLLLMQAGDINPNPGPKAGHRSTLAFLRFCVIAATGRRSHTQVEITSAHISNSATRKQSDVIAGTVPESPDARTQGRPVLPVLYAISQCYPTTVQLYATNVIFGIILSAWL